MRLTSVTQQQKIISWCVSVCLWDVFVNMLQLVRWKNCNCKVLKTKACVVFDI